jgi:FtsP/CotA-like multicopper oxidase with cupredoxin domain
MAEYQEFDTTREGIFGLEDAEEQRMHHFKHVQPPPSGALTIVDDMEVRFPSIPAGEIVDVPGRKVFREVELELPPSVLSRVSSRLGGDNFLMMWVIEGPNTARYPSEAIRVVQDKYLKILADNRRGPHTIHWHGIEPSSMNDGVGKHSFEISGAGVGGTGAFTYQFQPHQAGTFFFHCHKNTVHHFEMGMFGMLIIDPPTPSVDDDPLQATSPLTAPYTTGGAGYVAGRLDVGQPYNPQALNLVRYNQEKYWVADDMDAAWHNLVGENHDHNMQTGLETDPMNPSTFYVYGTATAAGSIELNDFQPDIFAVTGVVLDYGTTGPGGADEGTTPHYFGTVDRADISVNVDVQALGHQKILVRFLNAAYSIVDLKLPVNATITSMGGIPLGATDRTKYSRPYILPAGAILGSITARRFDLIIDTANLGSGIIGAVNDFATLTYYDWVKGRAGGKRAEIRIPINITNIPA